MRIAFAGNPNSGKTTMYNALTGRNEKVGNWAGVTVETKTAVIMAMINYGTYNQKVPRSCYYFRANHYHNFGIKYRHIDNTYFSLAENATD